MAGIIVVVILLPVAVVYLPPQELITATHAGYLSGKEVICPHTAALAE
ncbi:MAG: hypothetical protein HY786_09620 [Deltaproteobacteria bacterium]|nr:hypothetical protein [Deltaproteobacteria bacterium]